MTEAAANKTAIVLIHGTGGQEPRKTIMGFLSTLERLGLSPASHQQIYREPQTCGRGVAYFSAQTRINERPAVVAEFHWADLSKVRSGFLSILRNFFQFAVDAPDIIYTCLGPGGVDARKSDDVLLRCLRSLLALAVWIIYFPILAINLGYAALVAGFALHARSMSGVTPGSFAEITVAASSLVAGLAILLFLRRPAIDRYFRALAIMTLGVVVVGFCLGVAGPIIFKNRLTYRVLAAKFNGTLDLLWLIVMTTGFLFLLLTPLLLLRFWQRRHAILLAFTAAFLVFRFWLLLITTLWLIFLTSIFDRQTYQSLISDIGGPIRFISLLWFEMGAVGFAILVALAVHMRRTHQGLLKIAHAGYPRLIVPSSILILTYILNVAGLATVCWCNCAELWPGCRQPNCSVVYGSSAWIIQNAAILLTLGGLLLQLGESHFKVVIDILNYFHSDRGHRRVNPAEAMSSVFHFQPQDRTEFRPKLQQRLIALVADLDAQNGPFDRTILVGHSLGSMIAIEALRDELLRGNRLGSLELVTLGSPYQSIFNHYFPHMFTRASADLLPGDTGWTNIYRENDFVGTKLTEDNAGLNEISEAPHGHTNYLLQDSVVTQIARRVSAPVQTSSTELLQT